MELRRDWSSGLHRDAGQFWGKCPVSWGWRRCLMLDEVLREQPLVEVRLEVSKSSLVMATGCPGDRCRLEVLNVLLGEAQRERTWSSLRGRYCGPAPPAQTPREAGQSDRPPHADHTACLLWERAGPPPAFSREEWTKHLLSGSRLSPGPLGKSRLRLALSQHLPPVREERHPGSPGLRRG